MIWPNSSTKDFTAGNHGDLGNNTLDSPINGGEHENVATAVTGSPYSNSTLIDPIQSAYKGNRVTIVAHLLHRVNFVSRSTVAGSEVSIIKD
ncbi:hypothetical protein D3C85_1054980 [compost metagenome]